MGVVVFVVISSRGGDTRALTFGGVIGVGDRPHTIAETGFELLKVLLL